MASASPGPAWSTWPSALPFPDELARAEEEISARLPREVLNINRRLDQQQASIDKLQRDMSNLMAMVSQINTKLGKQPERTASPTEPPPTSTAFSTPPAYHPALSPIPEVSTPGDSSVSATAPPPARPLQFGNPNSLPYVAPKSCGEIPTPRSGYENYYYRHPNPIHSSCVQSGSTKLSEQHLDGLPHHYGFDNLNCQTVFRADGSEHSYFALPENYPLELATPEQVLNINDDKTDGCSNEFVDVFTSNLKLQQQKDEKTSNCLIIKASDSVFTRSNHFSMEQSMKELRLQWDPGDTKLSLLFMTAANATRLQCPYVSCPTINSSEILKHMVTLLSCWLFSFENRDKLQWDPGIAISSYSTPNAFTQVHYCCLPIVLDCSYSEPVQQLVCYSSILGSTETILSAMSMTSATTVHMTLVLSSGKIAQEEKNPAAVYHVLLIQLPMTKTSQMWDPGIESLFVSCKRLNIPELIQIKGWTSMTMGHLLSVKFFIETAAIICCSLPKLIQQRRNVAVVLYSWRSIFHDMHYRQIFQKCNAISSQFYWNQDIKFYGIALWLITFNPP